MASLALGAVGAGIGALLGGPVGAQLGFSLGVTLSGVIFPPKLDPQQRGRLDDVRLTGSAYGTMIPQVWGKARLGGNIIWASDLVEKHHTDEAGGKGMPQQEITTYSYFANLAVAVCSGPLEEVFKIYGDDVLLYDSTKSPETKYDITIYDGGEAQLADPLIESFEGAGNVPAFRGTAYVVFSMLPLKKFGNRIPQFTFEFSTGDATCADVLDGLFEQCGIGAGDRDFSAADEEVTGFILATRTSPADAAQPMLQILGVDLAEADGKIFAIPRGEAAALTIRGEDIGASFYDESSGSVSVAVRRIHDYELPVSVEVTYFDVDKNYQTGSQLAVRYTKGHLDGKLTVTVPMVLTHNQARRYAEYVLYQQWIERESYTATLPPGYLPAMPTLPVMLPLPNGETVRARVVAIDMAVFGPLAFSLVRDDSEILNQIIDGGDLGTDPGELDDPNTLLFFAFCCNALQDEDAGPDDIGFYCGAVGADGWEGGAVYKARGTAFKKIKGGLSESVTAGESVDALGPGTSSGIIDYSQTVEVSLIAGELSTVSEEELLGGANAALLGDEVIQFLEAEALSGSNYRLSGLIRGVRGTDYAWGSHVIAERFYLLSEGGIKRVELPRDLIGQTIHLKAISSSQALADVTAIDLEITGQELKPYSPTHIEGERDMSGNITLTWLRRARRGGEWADLTDVELDEEAERYQVEVYNGLTVVRTITGIASPTVGYSAAEQTTDFGSTQSAVLVKVYQLGDFKHGTTTSRMLGYPGTETI